MTCLKWTHLWNLTATFFPQGHILETSGVLFLQKDLSQWKKVCSGIQFFSKELFKIMFYLMKFHWAFFLLFSIPRVKSKRKNTSYLRQTNCVSAQAHAWGETVTKLVWRARQCFPNQRLLQALSLRLGRSWSLGGEGMREWSSSCESILQAILRNIVFFCQLGTT